MTELMSPMSNMVTDVNKGIPLPVRAVIWHDGLWLKGSLRRTALDACIEKQRVAHTATYDL